MDKKQYILNLLNQLEQQSSHLPDNIIKEADHLSRDIQPINSEEFDLETNMVETRTGSVTNTYNPDHIMYRLENLYSELEKAVKGGGRDQDRLISIMNQFRGLLDVPERYFP
ncbi:MAG: hypothetical protein H0Z33_00905 [Bacillaceae bacterium]|nr:hypothetical protein [Bacillaceae bacterium]